ncbi:PrsW family intramembrane metalloprotease [Patescibacteria group bacterium]|nr:PrsW family intramembrane metalloprotease [Patescibacteria group bacterium]
MVNFIINLLVIILLAALPAIVWLLFFLKEDPNKEPRKMLALTFVTGMLSSIPVLFLELSLQKIIVSPLHSMIIFVLGVSIIEEIFKFFAAYLPNNRSKYFDEPIDAMIYMIVAALGFATVENFFVVKNSLDFINLTNILDTLNSVALRFIGATLLHALASGIVGYYWALDHFKNKKSLFLLGFLLAIAVHSIFNFSVVKFQSSDIFYPTFFLVAIAFWVLADFERLKK